MTLTERIDESILTRTAIAKATKVSRVTLWRWEQGSPIEKVVQIVALAGALGCKPTDINRDLKGMA